MNKRKQSVRLDIYDLLREAHKSIREIYNSGLYESIKDESLQNAVDSVNGVLYLAEGEAANVDKGEA